MLGIAIEKKELLKYNYDEKLIIFYLLEG